MVIDVRAVPPGTEFRCDLCVVGAGPAGIAIVDRLRDSGLSIVLAEGGGFEPELSTQKLFRGENIGHPYFALDGCRYRLFGGSTNRWGGWCRPLERSDFEYRDWIPRSGWPINEGVLAPYYADAAKLFELTDPYFDLAMWQNRLPAPFPLDDTSFRSVFFQYSPETNFGLAYRARLLSAPHVTTLVYANLTRIELEPGTDRVGRLRISSLGASTCSIKPRAVVLATGGIENARLLLASQGDREAGLGNEHDNVARFFMEHPHVPPGHMLATQGAGGRKFYRKASYNGVRVRGVLAPTLEAQRRLRLLSTSIAIERASYSFGTPFVGWPPPITFGPVRLYRKLREGRYGRAVELAKTTAERLFSVPIRVDTWRAARAARRRAGGVNPADRIYSIYFRAEQVPDASSRVTLAGRRDALGVPEVRLNWRVNPVDTKSITGWLDVLDQDIRAQGIGRVIAPPEGWDRQIIGGPHHMGTTRMSADPRHGVVNADCRVHSVDNLYVAGSSVFATSGYANPTFTLVTLALRLADTLRDRLIERYSVQKTQ